MRSPYPSSSYTLSQVYLPQLQLYPQSGILTLALAIPLARYTYPSSSYNTLSQEYLPQLQLYLQPGILTLALAIPLARYNCPSSSYTLSQVYSFSFTLSQAYFPSSISLARYTYPSSIPLARLPQLYTLNQVYLLQLQL